MGNGIKSRLIGLVILGVITALVVVLFATSDGYLNRAGWVLLYVGVGLISGIAFWLATPGATGEVDLKKIGVKLGGGAGIGAGFMLLADFLAATPPRHVIVEIPEGNRNPTFSIYEADSGIEVTEISGQRLLVEFKGDQEAGWFRAEQLAPGARGFSKYECEVTRAGRITCDDQP